VAGIDPNWVIAGASVVNVIVLILYAVSTSGIRKATQRQAEETRRQAELTAELARQANAAFRLQVLAVYQEEIRAGRATSRTMAGVTLMEKVLALTFPEVWSELQKSFGEAAEVYKREASSQ
jgi:hypothetical protein